MTPHTFAYVTAATREYIPAFENLLRSIREYDPLRTVYAFLPESIGGGEIFSQMPDADVGLWESNMPSKFHLKFNYLNDVARLDTHTDYFVWIDADCELFGQPNLESFVKTGRNYFACLEGDILGRKIHWRWTPEQWRHLLQHELYPRTYLYNLNGGFFGVHGDYAKMLKVQVRSIVDKYSYLPVVADEAYLAFLINMHDAETEDLLIENHLNDFLYTFEWPRPTKFVNWITHKVTPLQGSLGIVHYIHRYKELGVRSYA